MRAQSFVPRPRSPWPGPIPYTEADARSFKGRDDWIGEVRDKLGRRLVLLTAESGVGKTSFIRAGLIPALRTARARHTSSDGPREPVVLLVRDWLAVRAPNADEMLMSAIRSSLHPWREREILTAYAGNDQIQKSIRADFRQLRSSLRSFDGKDTIDLVDALAGAVDSILLIFDQFEEAMHGRSDDEESMMYLIAEIHQLPGVRQLLSFRKDFISSFRDLDGLVGSLQARTTFLPNLDAPTLREALLESARAGGVALDADTCDELLSWIREYQARPRNSIAVSGADLLRLQAILRELFIIASGGDDDEAEPATAPRSSDNNTSVSISRDTIAILKEDLGGATGVEIVGRSLGQFLDRRVLPLPRAYRASGKGPAHFASPATISRRDERANQLRHVAARMATHLSSRDLKVQQYESVLISNIWRNQWPILGTTARDAAAALRAAEHERARRTTISDWLALPDEIVDRMVNDWLSEPADEVDRKVREALGLPDEELDRTVSGALDLPDAVIGKMEGIVSGPTRRESEQWTRGTLADNLVAMAHDTLRKLEDGNVVRPKQAPDGWVYELVHDGFGPAFVSWAEAEQLDPADLLGTVVAENGTTITWTALEGTIRDVCWRGCSIGPPPSRTSDVRLHFDGVRFEGCDLRGSIFKNCRFENCVFIQCELDGAIFENCEIVGTGGRRARFERVSGSGVLIKGGTIDQTDFVESYLGQMTWMFGRSSESDRLHISDVVIQDSVVKQLTAILVELVGPLRFESCWIGLCAFNGDSFIDTVSDPTAPQFTVDGSTVVQCLLTPAQVMAIDHGEKNRRHPRLEPDAALDDVPDDVNAWLTKRGLLAAGPAS